MPDFDYDLNLDTLGSSSHGLADNDSFEPNGHETTELNTHNPNSPPPDSLPLNTLPPDSQFPIPPTPSIIVKVEKHPCSAHHQHLLQRTTDQPVPTGHYPLSAKPFRLSTPLWDYTFSDVLIEPTQGQNPSINFSLCIHLDTSHLRAIKMFSTSWIKLLGLHQWYCLLFFLFPFFFSLFYLHITFFG